MLRMTIKIVEIFCGGPSFVIRLLTGSTGIIWVLKWERSSRGPNRKLKKTQKGEVRAAQESSLIPSLTVMAFAFAALLPIRHVPLVHT